MKRSSNVKRSSMDKSFKVGRIIPFVAFGGIFFLATHESKTEGYIYTDADKCVNRMRQNSANSVKSRIKKLYREQKKTHRAITMSTSVKTISTKTIVITARVTVLMSRLWEDTSSAVQSAV